MPLSMAHKQLLLFGSNPYGDFVSGLTPVLWLRLREISGSVAANSGSLGSGFDGTIVSVTLAQTGALGADEAGLWDGANSMITIPNTGKTISTYATYTRAYLVKATSAGEGTNGVFSTFLNNTANYTRFGGALTAISAGETDATSTKLTSTSNGLTAGKWTWVFHTFDNAGDRKGHIYYGVNGVVAEATYSAQNALTDTRVINTATPFVIGNRQLADWTFDGYFDEFFMTASVLTTAQMQILVNLSGV